MQQTTNQENETPLAQAAMPQFRNAVPIVVTIVPVLGIDPQDQVEKVGVLAIRRDIPPKIGELAFPAHTAALKDFLLRAGELTAPHA